MTDYPYSIDSTLQLPTVSGITDEDVAINALRDAIIALETELGVTPHGIYSDVSTRLSILESRIGPGATITGGSIDINTANLTGVLSIAKGGTALSSVGAVNTVITSAGATILYKLLTDSNIASAAAISISKLLASSTDGYVITTISGIPTWTPPLALGGVIFTFSSDTNYTLAASEYAYDWIQFNTGSWGSGHTIVLPAPATIAAGYHKTIFNNTLYTMTISTGSGTTRTLATVKAQRFWFDNSGVRFAGSAITV